MTDVTENEERRKHKQPPPTIVSPTSKRTHAWNMRAVEPSTSSSSIQTNADLAIEQIIQQEQQAIECRAAAQQRRKQKPLAAIQTEERAMEQLRLAYEMDTNNDEYITIERVHDAVVACAARPVWQARGHNGQR
jgi:hypothetical protein